MGCFKKDEIRFGNLKIALYICSTFKKLKSYCCYDFKKW